MADLAPIYRRGRRIGPGAQRAANWLAGKLAAHPPLVQSNPSRQVARRQAFRLAKVTRNQGRRVAAAAALKAWRDARKAIA